MWLLANIDFQVPDIDFFHLVPVFVFGFLLTAALCLELRDDLDKDSAPSIGKPAILGLGVLSLLGLLTYYLSWSGPLSSVTFNEMLYNDPLSRVCGSLITLCALLTILAGPEELERFGNFRGGEFCALIFSASLGMILMSSAANTIVLFLGLELFSIALYLLCIFLPDRDNGRESGMKYFLLSSAASAVMLYGLALLYGATGTTWFQEMSLYTSDSLLSAVGAILVLCGLLFKLAVAPFHFWAPDVYQGAPTTATAFMSVATKVAALAALWRFLLSLAPANAQICILILCCLSLLSMILGNLLALAQKSIKRMLAFSGVANAGYMLMAPVVGAPMLGSLLFFLTSYLLANIGAFLALAQIEAIRDRDDVEKKDLAGLFHSHPWLAICFALCLVSLAGLPPAAGFMGKFFLFGSSIGQGMFLLPMVGIVGSLIGAAYYLGTAVALFSKSNDEERTNNSEIKMGLSQVALVLCCLGVLILGLFPQPVLNFFY